MNAADPRELIRVGLITRAHGVRGEVVIKPLTDDPERFRSLRDVYLEAGGGACGGKPEWSAGIRPARLETARTHRGSVIARISGCDDADAANALRGSYISITKEQLVPLREGSFFDFDLVGCAVYEVEGLHLGTLTDVLETGSNDVYVVRPPEGNAGGLAAGGAFGVPGGSKGPRGGGAGRELLIPALKSVVKEVRISEKRIVVDWDRALEGGGEN
ncbi:MAG: ribosome maturation factor RimM [Clostridiales bacterium]|jgi:16S rRNA processing protein RimM|nr:ribosome maturation factor RimM [Clostridiales bacterium]